MSIQIIDNFNLSVAKPIDDRFVVGSQSLYPNVSYNNKNDIPYKYAGLRVWDLDLGVPFVWSGTSWTSENSISISGSGSASYVPKFVGPPNSSTLGNSNIYISGNSVGINNTSITAGYILDIIGGVRSQGATGFSGVGTLLTNLNATNISTGTMSLARLANNNTSGWIITSSASQPVYVNPSAITVGAASASVVFNETGNSNVHYVGFFSNSTGSLQSKVSKFSTSTNTLSRQLTYQPSSGILASAIIQAGTFSVDKSLIIVPASTSSTPAINFSSYAGIYYTTTPNLGISVSGTAKLIVEQNAVNFGPQSNNYPRIRVSSTSTAAAPSYTWWGNDQTGIFRPSSHVVGISTNGIERARFTDDGISMISSTYTNKWSVTSISQDCWISNLAGSTTTTTAAGAADLPSATYDRIIYANHAGSGVVQIDLQAETASGTFEMLNRSAPNGYSGTMMILPAGKKWRAYFDYVSGSGAAVQVTFHIYKLGR